MQELCIWYFLSSVQFSRNMLPALLRLSSLTRMVLVPFHVGAFLRAGEYEYQDAASESEVVHVNFVLQDGTMKKVKGKVGDNVMYLAHRYSLKTVNSGLFHRDSIYLYKCYMKRFGSPVSFSALYYWLIWIKCRRIFEQRDREYIDI